MNPPNEIERVLLCVNQFLRALDGRSWEAFASCFDDSATVFLADKPEDPEQSSAWQDLREGWRQVFDVEVSRPGPVDPLGRRPLVELRGNIAVVSFTSRQRRERRAMVLSLADDTWLIRHLHVARLPLRPLLPVEVRTVGTPNQEPDTGERAICPFTTPVWFVPALVASLVLIALLGTLADRRGGLQLAAAVLAVFFGAVTLVRGELSTWFPDSQRRDVPLTSSGALVIAVGAAFLAT